MKAVLDMFGKSRIKNKPDGLFVEQSKTPKSEVYNLPDLDLGLKRDEIVSYIKEVRER